MGLRRAAAIRGEGSANMLFSSCQASNNVNSNPTCWSHLLAHASTEPARTPAHYALTYTFAPMLSATSKAIIPTGLALSAKGTPVRTTRFQRRATATTANTISVPADTMSAQALHTSVYGGANARACRGHSKVQVRAWRRGPKRSGLVCVCVPICACMKGDCYSPILCASAPSALCVPMRAGRSVRMHRGNATMLCNAQHTAVCRVAASVLGGKEKHYVTSQIVKEQRKICVCWRHLQSAWSRHHWCLLRTIRSQRANTHHKKR
jgi:hypothetical protein